MGVIQTLRAALSGPALRSALARPRSSTVRSVGGPPAPVYAAGGGPPIGTLVNAPRHYSPIVRQLAIDADPAKVTAIYNRADFGDTPDLMDLFDGARDHDARLNAVSVKRIQGIQRCPIVFEPPEELKDDREAKQVAADVSRILLRESRKFRQQVGALAHGALNGYAVSEKVWRQNADGEWVPDLKWKHPDRFCWLDEDTPAWCEQRWITASSSQAIPLADYTGKFVVHAPMAGRASYPWRRGAYRPLILLSLAKRFGVRWWAQLIERFGMPQLWANVPDNVDNDDDRAAGIVQQILASFQDLNEDWAAVFGAGVRVNSIPLSGQVRSDLHKSFVDWVNVELAIGVLGQNLTTEVQGGSLAAATAHRFVADDVLEADGDEADETLTQQVVEDVVRYNWPGAPVPRARIITSREQPWTVQDVQEGLASPDEYRSHKGAGALPGGQGTDLRRPLSVQVPPGFPTSPFGPLALPAPAADASGTPEKVKPGDVIDVEAAPDQAVAKDPAASLNGAQVASMKEIVQDVANGLLPRETGIQMIVASFPVSEQQAEKIMGTVGAGFVPKAADEPSVTIASRAPTHSGVMVAAYPSPELAADLALDGGEPAEELHVTLAYFGRVDELDEDQLETLATVLELYARGHDPLEGEVGGIGRFTAAEGPDALYGSVDVPGLSRLRTALVEALEQAGVPPRADHDFTPHITLAYLEPGSAMPIQSLEPRALRIDALDLVVGSERQSFPLRAPASGGTPPASPFGRSQTATRTTTRSTSPTSARSTHPLARALSRR